MTRMLAMTTSILIFALQVPAGHSTTTEEQALVDFARTQFDDADIDAEVQTINDELPDIPVYPFASISVGIRF